MRPRTIAVDLDGTLIYTDHLYHQAAHKCAGIIHAALRPRSPSPIAIHQYREDQDHHVLLPEYGAKIMRFPLSWKRTYYHFAIQAGVQTRPEIEEALDHASEAFVRGPFWPTPAAKTVLAELVADGHTLYCVTWGEEAEDLQLRKIRANGFERYFAGVIMTGEDKRPHFRSLFNGAAGRGIVVGDSLNHDIQPAVELGLHAFYVSGTTLRSAMADIDPARYTKLESLSELPAAIRQLE